MTCKVSRQKEKAERGFCGNGSLIGLKPLSVVEELDILVNLLTRWMLRVLTEFGKLADALTLKTFTHQRIIKMLSRPCSPKMIFLYFCISIIIISLSMAEVHVGMCNEASYHISYDPLPDSDLKRIKKLEQLQIISRHGARTGDRSVLSIFPNMDTSIPNTEWTCNFTSVTSRAYGDMNFISLQKNYVSNEELIGVNCVSSQSVYQVIQQHRKNADLIYNFYVGNDSNHLFSEQDLNGYVEDMFVDRKYENNNMPFIKMVANDLERTYSTVSVFMTYFLNTAATKVMEQYPEWHYNGIRDYLYSYTHDPNMDPYIPKVAGCPDLTKWIISNGMNSDKFQEFINGDFVKDFWAQWKEEVGTEFTDSEVCDCVSLCGEEGK